MAVTANVGTTSFTNNTAPTITVPAGVNVGDVILVAFALNNQQSITARPSQLTLQGANPFIGTTQGTSEIYTGVIDGTTLTAGTVLNWTLSTTRACVITLQAYSGVDNAAPIHAISNVIRTSTTSVHTAPALTTTATAHIVESFYGKASSSSPTLSSMSPPAGFTMTQSRYATGTFNIGISAADSADQPAGNYGGDVWTANTTTNPESIWTIALAPAATAPAYSDTAALTGAGALTFTVVPADADTRAATGTGTLTLAASNPATAATRTGTGTGALTFGTAAAAAGTLNTAGTGTLTLATVPRQAATLARTGTGALTFGASAASAGTLNTAGNGTLSLSTAGAGSDTLNLAGNGAFSATGIPSGNGILARTGAGTLAAAGNAAAAASLSRPGTGTLTLTAAAPNTASSLQLGGTGTLQTSGTAGWSATLNTAGAGTLTLTPAQTAAFTLQLSGTGLLDVELFTPPDPFTYTARIAPRLWSGQVQSEVWAARIEAPTFTGRTTNGQWAAELQPSQWQGGTP